MQKEKRKGKFYTFQQSYWEPPKAAARSQDTAMQQKGKLRQHIKNAAVSQCFKHLQSQAKSTKGMLCQQYQEVAAVMGITASKGYTWGHNLKHRTKQH